MVLTAARVDGWVRGVAVVDVQPHSLRAAHAAHHDKAGRWNAAALRVPRLAWAYLVALPCKAVSGAWEWVTFSPLRLAAAVITFYAIRHWL